MEYFDTFECYWLGVKYFEFLKLMNGFEMKVEYVDTLDGIYESIKC